MLPDEQLAILQLLFFGPFPCRAAEFKMNNSGCRFVENLVVAFP